VQQDATIQYYVSYIPASRLSHSRSRGTFAKKRKARKKTCTILTGADDRRQYNFLKKLYTSI
jgi:hypothetical protein